MNFLHAGLQSGGPGPVVTIQGEACPRQAPALGRPLHSRLRRFSRAAGLSSEGDLWNVTLAGGLRAGGVSAKAPVIRTSNNAAQVKVFVNIGASRDLQTGAMLGRASAHIPGEYAGHGRKKARGPAGPRAEGL